MARRFKSSLEIDGLTVRFGGLTAVNNVSMRIAPAEFAGLIGPNGAGKTTFIDAVTGLVRAEGEVRLGDIRVSGLTPDRRARHGVVRTFQSLELFEDLTVEENLLVAASHQRWWSAPMHLVWPRAGREARLAVTEALELLDLSDQAEALPPELSLGERKLVSVARCVAARPSVLLLDEPAAGLDSEESQVLGQKLMQLTDAGMTVFLVDHDMGLVLGVCDVIHVLDAGRLIATGSPNEIRANDVVVEAYLGAHAVEGPEVGGLA